MWPWVIEAERSRPKNVPIDAKDVLHFKWTDVRYENAGRRWFRGGVSSRLGDFTFRFPSSATHTLSVNLLRCPHMGYLTGREDQ